MTTETVQDRSFSLRRVLREFRRPLIGGLILVVLDAVAGLLGPYLVKTGIDSGVQTGSGVILAIASGLFLVVTLADMVDEIAETFVTGRLAQRVMLSPCASASSPSCSVSRSTTTSARWAAES